MSVIKPIAALAAAFACVAAQAQGPAQPSEVRRAASPPAADRPLRFSSTLRSYRGFIDEPIASWREANDTVLRIGGWQAYGRESREALRAPAPPAPRAAAPAAPAPDAHDAHHGARK
jgi:hypothetical protein